MTEIERIIREWYPTFKTHTEWLDDVTCPCKDCYDVRVKGATKAIEQYVIKARIETALKCRHFVSERYLLEWDSYIEELKKGIE